MEAILLLSPARKLMTSLLRIAKEGSQSGLEQGKPLILTTRGVGHGLMAVAPGATHPGGQTSNLIISQSMNAHCLAKTWQTLQLGEQGNAITSGSDLDTSAARQSVNRFKLQVREDIGKTFHKKEWILYSLARSRIFGPFPLRNSPYN